MMSLTLHGSVYRLSLKSLDAMCFSFMPSIQRINVTNCYTLWPMESNSLKCSSIQAMPLIELKFGMYIIDHRLTYCIDFGEFRITSFLLEYKKKFYTL